MNKGEKGEEGTKGEKGGESTKGGGHCDYNTRLIDWFREAYKAYKLLTKKGQISLKGVRDG